MGRLDDLGGNDELANIKRRLHALETRNPLSDSAVSGGRTRFIGEDSFLIEGSGGVSGTLTIDGLELVNGELRISGELNVSGPTKLGGDTSVSGRFDVTGPASIDGDTDINGHLDIKGDTTVTGPFHVDGAADFDGPLKIKGDATLSGDLEIDDNGRITVGGMTIGKFGGRGKVDFGVGELASDGSKVALQSGAALVGVGGVAQLTFGGNGIQVDSSGAIRIGALPLADQPPNLYIDSSNRLWRASGTVPTTGGSGGSGGGTIQA